LLRGLPPPPGIAGLRARLAEAPPTDDPGAAAAAAAEVAATVADLAHGLAPLTDLRPRDEFYGNNRRWGLHGGRYGDGPVQVDVVRPGAAVSIPGCEGFASPG
jgi:hypothetical protein